MIWGKNLNWMKKKLVKNLWFFDSEILNKSYMKWENQWKNLEISLELADLRFQVFGPKILNKYNLLGFWRWATNDVEYLTWNFQNCHVTSFLINKTNLDPWYFYIGFDNDFCFWKVTQFYVPKNQKIFLLSKIIFNIFKIVLLQKFYFFVAFFSGLDFDTWILFIFDDILAKNPTQKT